MATKSGGRPLNSLIENNFKKGDATSAKSNRYWWNCNHCDTRIDGRNNNLFEHLTDAVKCINCPQETRREALKNVADGKPTRRRHAHMHTTELPGIDTDVAKQLETDFAFVPPLAAVSGDTSCNLEGPKSISLDDIDAEFARLEDIRNGEKVMDLEFPSDWDVDGKEVLEGNVFDFAELQRVDEGLVPAAVEDEIMVTDHDANEDGTWNIDSMLVSSGLTSM